ncbi:ketosteroid isomerase [Pelomyxa schiedti]|nr:ketosteroid isomerase [Pelomyxa schiedti]
MSVNGGERRGLMSGDHNDGESKQWHTNVMLCSAATVVVGTIAAVFAAVSFAYVFQIWSTVETPTETTVISTYTDTVINYVTSNNLVSVQQLLSMGADPNSRNPSGMTLLMIAAGRGYMQMVDLLLNAGADPTWLDSRMGTTALHMACQGGNPDIVTMLAEHGAFLDLQAARNGHTALMDAVWYKNPDAVQRLVDLGANMYLYSHYGKNATMFIETGKSAKDQNLYDKIQLILDNYAKSIDETISNQLLFNAVLAHDIDTVRELLSTGYTNIDERRPNTMTPEDGYTPLLLAARDGETEIVEVLLEYGADITAVDYFMKATAGHKCAYNGFPDTCQSLIDNGGLEIDAQGPVNGKTALHDAIWHGHSEAASVLINGGARTDLFSWDGLSVYQEAKKFWYYDIMDLVNDTEYIPPSDSFIGKVLGNDLVAVQILLQQGQDVNQKDSNGMTGLHYASGRCFAQMVDLLLNSGASPVLLDSEMGTSALHLAAQGGCVDVASLLLEHGAFLDLNNAFAGHTPLQEAVWYKNPTVSTLLMESGANLAIQNHYGNTVDDFLDDSPVSTMDVVINNATSLALENRIQEIEDILDSQQLNAATMADNLTAVNLLLAAGYTDLNERRPNIGVRWDGYTPLLLAAINGYSDIFSKILHHIE